MTALLQLEGLAVGWPGGGMVRRAVLEGLDLRLARGERVGLVGPNGSGKSTLFLTLAGVLAPLAGEVRIGGEALVPGRFHPGVGLVFQQAEDQLFCPTLAEDVAFGLHNRGLPEAEIAARLARALDDCDLTGLADRPVHHLSGGEKRRAALAGILALGPELLLLDEPSAALDLRSRRRLIALLAARDEAMLIASHDLELVLDLCPRVVVIDGGRLCADGPARDVLGDGALMAAHGQEVPHSLLPHDPPRHRHG
ncbi:MAG: ABC transporter ATP-binding protein [Rubellimicrobium sp.]|nr:ABC transporter ATP-binding protein [Rubellimicrobium sp.]